jgi:hypothetical protein
VLDVLVWIYRTVVLDHWRVVFHHPWGDATGTKGNEREEAGSPFVGSRKEEHSWDGFERERGGVARDLVRLSIRCSVDEQSSAGFE